MDRRKKFEKKDVYREVTEAEKRIRNFVRKTYLEHSLYLSKLCHCNVYIKLENTQITGSFKLRGAFNSILSLSDNQKSKGIITASTGNHGAAVSYALRSLGVNGKIFVPENISHAKLEMLKAYDADLIFHGTDNAVTEAAARRTAESENKFYISPYNDRQVIGGQGTIGIELMDQIKDVDAVFIPIGGGGLAAGISGYLKSVAPQITIIGCQPENSPVMAESVKAGRIVDLESLPTLSDGTAGGMDPGSLTFDICRKHVDDYVLVSEEEIRDALVMAIQRTNMMIEGAAALSLASFLKIRKNFEGKNVILIFSGNKLSLSTIKTIINSGG